MHTKETLHILVPGVTTFHDDPCCYVLILAVCKKPQLCLYQPPSQLWIFLSPSLSLLKPYSSLSAIWLSLMFSLFLYFTTRSSMVWVAFLVFLGLLVFLGTNYFPSHFAKSFNCLNFLCVSLLQYWDLAIYFLNGGLVFLGTLSIARPFCVPGDTGHCNFFVFLFWGLAIYFLYSLEHSL